MKFKSKDELNEHGRVKHSYKPISWFSFEQCDMKYRRTDQLKEHFDSVHIENYCKNVTKPTII